jgi:hypothetical protein
MKNIETQAKELLPNYASPMNTERLWANIESQLKEDKKEYAFLWLWKPLLGAALLVGLCFGIYCIKNKNIPANESMANAGNLMLPTMYSPILAGAIGSILPAPPTPKWGSKSEVFWTIGHKLPTMYSPILGVGGDDNIEPIAPAQLSYNGADQQHTVQFFSTNHLSIKEDQETIAQNNETQNTTTNLNPFTSQSRNKSNPPILNQSTLQPLKSETPKILPQWVLGPETNCYSFKKKPIAPYFGIYGGAQYPIKTFTYGTEYKGLVQKRKDSETILEGTSIGAFIGFSLKGGLSIEGGAEYNSINERFDWQKTVRDTIGQTVVLSYLLNAPGDTTRFSDTAYVVRNTIDSRKIYNHYRSIYLPISVGYEFKNKGKWKPYIKGGIALNLRFRQKAEIYDLSGVPTSYESNTSPAANYPFKTKLSIAPFVNIGTSFLLTPRMELFGELRYFHHSKKITNDSYPIGQGYKLLGANLGVRFRM